MYFGTDAGAVAAGTVPAATQTEHSFTPSSLAFGTTYYWKVDEVGDAGTYAGNLWSFTIQGFGSLEDFESYNDNVDAGTTIYQTWIDGVTTGASGSTVGYAQAAQGTFGERTIVHSGGQSMPLQYDNTTAPFYSETEREFAAAQNWTDKGADALRLYVRGNGGQLPGDDQGRDDHECHRDRHLGHRRPVPLRL